MTRIKFHTRGRYPRNAPLLKAFRADEVFDRHRMGFMFACLDLILQLRQEARGRIAGTSGQPWADPEEGLEMVLDMLRECGDELSMPQEFVRAATSNIEDVIRAHLGSFYYPSPWIALQAGAQDLADQLAVTVGGVADEMEEVLADLKNQSSRTDDDEKAVASMTRLIGMMRGLLAHADQVGEPAEA